MCATWRAGAPNGRGNLIVGYDTGRFTGSDKSGSHYLVVGDDHNFTAFGGIVTGFSNTASGDWASVSGGPFNIARGDFASVSGGFSNIASGQRASVSGGQLNDANGFLSWILGGNGITVSEIYGTSPQ